jgi:hypothetical protein
MGNSSVNSGNMPYSWSGNTPHRSGEQAPNPLLQNSKSDREPQKRRGKRMISVKLIDMDSRNSLRSEATKYRSTFIGQPMIWPFGAIPFSAQ